MKKKDIGLVMMFLAGVWPSLVRAESSLNTHNTLKTPEKCFSYSVQGNEVTFHCTDSAKVRLKLCGNSVLKVWYAPDGKFERPNESFAVINENSIRIKAIEIAEIYQVLERTCFSNSSTSQRNISSPKSNSGYVVYSWAIYLT